VKRVVGFSGGIDSQAVALWVRQRFPADEIILLNSDAGGNESPVTSGFIHWYSDTVFPVTTIQALIKDLEGRGTKPGITQDRRQEFAEDDLLTFERLAYIKQRFPSRKAQFCTEHLKLAPQRRWCAENLVANGLDFERYVGIRRDEGQNSKDPRDRSNTPDAIYDDYFDCTVFYPMAAWDKQRCFDFVRDAGEEVNPLYRAGHGRVGCAPCVNSGKEDVRNWAARSPEMIDKIRGWEHANKRTFFPPCIPNAAYEKALKAWMAEWTVKKDSPEAVAWADVAAEIREDELEMDTIPEESSGGCLTTIKGKRFKKLLVKPGAPAPPPRPVNWIDEVVTWSRTAWGGRQFLMPMLEAEPLACSSKYGLCE
jgi:3'-phosphoadenosine 5'-phosphosulfate sulfotransferase (PAPS reductase)/FAD synthetase